MKRLRAAMFATMRRWRITLAQILVRSYGLDVTARSPWDTARNQLGDFIRYTEASGHLTRAYHAGRKIRQLAANINDSIANARDLK